MKRKETCEEEVAGCWRLLRERRAESPVGYIYPVTRKIEGKEASDKKRGEKLEARYTGARLSVHGPHVI